MRKFYKISTFTEYMQEAIQAERKITKDMTIGELVQKYPSVAGVLQSEGVHCVGCGASYYETIEEGLKGHGRSDQEIEAVVQKLNAAIPQETGNAELTITENATVKLKEILKHKGKEGYGLRIRVQPGGCAGNSYAFALEEKEQEDDVVHTIDGVRFFVDTESAELLNGSKIDYVDSLTGAGFKVSNPNAQKSCACGQSFR